MKLQVFFMIILYFKLFFFTFFYFFFINIIIVFWSNEINKKSLNKVIQRIQNYLNLNFYNNWINIYRVISISYNSIIF